jgi:hypothetical protein
MRHERKYGEDIVAVVKVAGTPQDDPEALPRQYLRVLTYRRASAIVAAW